MQPKENVFLGIQFDKPSKMGMIQRTLVNLALAFVKKMNKGFHFNCKQQADDAERQGTGMYEKPHISFPLQTAVDRFVVSKPGEKLPELGGVVFEDETEVKNRKKGASGTFKGWNTTDTYTLIIWSAYAEWSDWKVVNLPGVRPFSIAACNGNQPVNFVVYDMDSPPDSQPSDKVNHFEGLMRKFLNMEMYNKGITIGGSVERFLVDEYDRAKSPDDSFVVSNSDDSDDNDDNDNDIGSSSNDELPDIEDESDSDGDDNKSEEETTDDFTTDDQVLIKAGDPIVFHVDGACMTNGGGFAVLQQGFTAADINLVRVSPYPNRQKRGSRRRQKDDKLLRNGDTVLVRYVHTSLREMRYLSTHRGWWLKWVSSAPKHNGTFRIDGLEDGECLSVGMSFVLRHNRWNQFVVGCSPTSSAKYGGRLLGLTKEDGVEETQAPGDGKKPWMQILRLQANHSKNLEINGTEVDAQSTAVNDPESTSLSSQTAAKSTGTAAAAAAAAAAATATATPTATATATATAAATATATATTTMPATKDEKDEVNPNMLSIDVPAWVELMHRSDRKRVLAYVVRARPKDNDGEGFISLRTGRDLTPILQLRRTASVANSNRQVDDIDKGRNAR